MSNDKKTNDGDDRGVTKETKHFFGLLFIVPGFIPAFQYVLCALIKL